MVSTSGSCKISSKAFPKDAPTSARFPRESASITLAAWRDAELPPWASANRYASFVLTPTGGLQTTNQPPGSSGARSSRSPIPWTRAEPPHTQKGTSAPTVRPISQSVSSGNSARYIRLSACRAAAASALPPAKPAWEGIRFSISIERFGRCPITRKNASAARYTVFSSPHGTSVRPQVTESPSPPCRRVRMSHREIVCITMSKRW